MKTITSKIYSWLTICIVASTISLNCYATVLVSESFDYADGSLVGQNGGTGWDGAWTDSGNVLGNQAVPEFNSANSFRQLENAIAHTDGTAIYLSFDINSIVNVTGAFAGLSFYSGISEEVFVGKTFFETSFGIEVTGVGATSANSNDTIANMVVEILFGSVDTTFNLFVNPLNLMSDATFSVTTNTGVLGGSWDRIRLASGGNADLQASFDNITIATQKQDVIVPEPAVYGLFLIACLALFKQKRYL